MVIRLSDYRKAKTMQTAVRLHGEEEPLCVNGNPAFRLIALSCYQRPQEPGPQLSEDFAALEPASFERVYALASQI
jgi:hypothetical protein